MPKTELSLTKIPIIKDIPRSVRPHSFIRLIIGKTDGLKRKLYNGRKAFAPFIYGYADHDGFITFVIPA